MNPDTPILTVLGFGMQYLRGLRAFNDGYTLLVSVVFGMLASWLLHGDQPLRQLIIHGFEMVPTVWGGTFAAHIAAQYTPAVPKWNAYSRAKNGNGGKK